MKLVFATNNINKIIEVQQLLPETIEIVSLESIGCFEEIPETGSTLAENSMQKAKYIADRFGVTCLADDSGLEVEALNGAPGVYSARYAGIPKKERLDRAMVALEKVGLTDRSHHKSNELSGGQIQRVAIARALVNNPAILLADEPTGNLDTKSADAVFELLRRVSTEQGTSVLFVTHNPELAERCDKTIQVVDGQVV